MFQIKTSCLRDFVPSCFKTMHLKKLFLNKLLRADHFVVTIDDLDDIKFIGRYGTWNRKWKTELVIEESIK